MAVPEPWYAYGEGVRPGLANAAPPTLIEGQLANASFDLSGNQRVVGTLTTSPPGAATATAPAQQGVGTAAGQILAANVNRVRLKIQNTGTSRIKLGFGQVPTQTAYHVCLPACGNADDGSSEPYIDEIWKGAVNAISSVGGGTVVVEEDTT